MVFEILTYRQAQKLDDIKKKTIDPNNYLKNTDISKITSNICYSNDPNVGLFLKDNPHLIDYYKLADNCSDWSLDFCLEYIYKEFNNISIFYLGDLVNMLIKNYENKIFTNKFCEFLYKNTLVNKIIDNNNKISNLFNYILNKLVEEKNIDLIKSNSQYILRYCNLEELNLIKKINPELFNETDNYETIYINNNTEIVEFIINNLKFDGEYSLNYFGRNTNDLAAKYIIENFLEKKNSKDNCIIYSIMNNPNDILVDYILDKIKKKDRRYNINNLYNNSNDKVQDFIENKNN